MTQSNDAREAAYLRDFPSGVQVDEESRAHHRGYLDGYESATDAAQAALAQAESRLAEKDNTGVIKECFLEIHHLRTQLAAAREQGIRDGLDAAARAFKGNLETVKRIRAIDPQAVADAGESHE